MKLILDGMNGLNVTALLFPGPALSCPTLCPQGCDTWLPTHSPNASFPPEPLHSTTFSPVQPVICEFNTFTGFSYGPGIARGRQGSIHSINQLSIFVKPLLCVLGANYTAENQTAFMEFIIYREGGGDRGTNYTHKCVLR